MFADRIAASWTARGIDEIDNGGRAVAQMLPDYG